MNIQQFQYVVAVAANRHFQTAADKCFVSQSTLSTMISKFEDEIGVTIFDRSKKPVEVTQEGAVIVNQLKVINHEIAQLTEFVKEMKGEVKGTLKISCIPTVAPFLLPQFLPEFSNHYPDLFFEIKEDNTNEIVRKLKSRDLDIGILSLPIADEELNEMPLYDEPYLLYDGSGNSDSPVSIDHLNLNNFWLLEEGHCMRDEVLEFCNRSRKRINPALNINFKAGSLDSLLRFTRANMGKTLLPYMFVNQSREVEEGMIRPLKAPIPYRTIGLVTHRHFAKHKVLKLFADEILKSLKPIRQISFPYDKDFQKLTDNK